MVQAHTTRAPWEVTTVVSCLPILVLGMGMGIGTAPAHLLRTNPGPRWRLAQMIRAGRTACPDREDQAAADAIRQEAPIA
ncbi:MAG: hypothetical protein ACRDNZ_03880 [Streptosporangiaceae bacterium]